MSAPLVLIVEDNEKNLKLFRDVLQSSGYRTLEARTGGEGLQAVADSRPDLVLMDIQLPDMDGIHALRAIRGAPKSCGIPVIAVSASVMPMERQQAISAGFDGFQEKPIRVREFLRCVSDALRAPGGTA